MPQAVPFHEHAHPLHVRLLGAQAIVFVTNSLTDPVQPPCARSTGGKAVFMAEFITVFSYGIRAVKLGYKPLSA